MATKLIKPVRREMLAVSTVGKYRNRPIIVTIDGGDVIRFQIKGTRQSYETSLHFCYRLAQIMTWEEQYQQRKKEYEIKKKAGYKRLRKPRQIVMHLDKATIKAFNLSTK